MATRRPDEPTLPRDELEAAVAARRELGDELEPHLVQSFLDRVERGLDARIDERLASRRLPTRKHDDHSFELAIFSLICGVVLAIGAMAFGPDTAWVAAVGWLAIVIVNRVYRNR